MMVQYTAWIATLILCSLASSQVNAWTLEFSGRRAQQQPLRLLSTPHHSHPQRPETPQESITDVLKQVEITVSNVLQQYYYTSDSHFNKSNFVLSLPSKERESYSVALLLQKRLQSFRRNNDCPRCWLQRAHCICDDCPPLLPPQLQPHQHPLHFSNGVQIRRIFLLMHHKEICLAVDTAKLILACFPEQCRLIVAGIGAEYQSTMQELQDAMLTKNCLVLFPTDDAVSFDELLQQQAATSSKTANKEEEGREGGWDLVVIDGTWNQARKLHAKYIPSQKLDGPQRVQLSSQVLDTFQLSNENSLKQDGRQLRRHPIDWRTISTMEATRLLFRDMASAATTDSSKTIFSNMTAIARNNSQDWNRWTETTMKDYQIIANRAAQKQLGPPRVKM